MFIRLNRAFRAIISAFSVVDYGRHAKCRSGFDCLPFGLHL
jgi:hypothetical protein